MVAQLDGSLRDIFPQNTEEQRDQFKHFDYAYIGARYDPGYKISKDELDYFATRGKRLIELAEKICLTSLADENFSWKEL